MIEGIKETAGEASARLLSKKGEKVEVEEQMRGMLSEFEENIFECVATNKKKYPGDFYVVVLIKKEKLMPNMFRHFFLARESCPTPNYDQVVYRFKRKEEEIELLWVLPGRDEAHEMLNYRHQVPPDQYELLGYVLKFKDKSLMLKVKELNGEELDSGFLRD